MSGKPNTEGVKTLRQHLLDFYWTRGRIAELKKSISEQQESLKLREAELRVSLAAIEGKLAEMDVASPGNFGWEERHLELLLMLCN